MFVSPKYAKSKKIPVKARIIVVEGNLNGMELCLVGKRDCPSSHVDYKNIYGNNITLLDDKSRYLLMFPPGKKGAHGDRLTILLIGSAGVGKTTTCIDYALLYRLKQFPNHRTHPIYWISRTCDDSRISKLLGTPIKIEDPETGIVTTRYLDPRAVWIDVENDRDWHKYFEDPETRLWIHRSDDGSISSNLNDSLIIIDDVSNLEGHKPKILDSFITNVLNLGRHNCASLVWSRHEYSGYRNNERSSVKEFNMIYLFCQSNINKGRLVKFSKDVLGLRELIDYASTVSETERYISVYNKYPSFIMTSKDLAVI